jgi:hypothetical protein
MTMATIFDREIGHAMAERDTYREALQSLYRDAPKLAPIASARALRKRIHDALAMPHYAPTSKARQYEVG